MEGETQARGDLGALALVLVAPQVHDERGRPAAPAETRFPDATGLRVALGVEARGDLAALHGAIDEAHGGTARQAQDHALGGFDFIEATIDRPGVREIGGHVDDEGAL